MSLILDLTQLVSGSKHIERHTLTVFEGVLKSCHELIVRYNKEQIKHIYYDVPSYVFGKPMYDVDVLINYLIHHLTDNGLFVQRTEKPKQLLISWDDKYINIDRFYRRQQTIKTEQHNIMMGGMPANVGEGDRGGITTADVTGRLVHAATPDGELTITHAIA